MGALERHPLACVLAGDELLKRIHLGKKSAATIAHARAAGIRQATYEGFYLAALTRHRDRCRRRNAMRTSRERLPACIFSSHPRAMDLDRPRADPELPGDRLLARPIKSCSRTSRSRGQRSGATAWTIASLSRVRWPGLRTPSHHEAVGLERLLDEVPGAELHRLTAIGTSPCPVITITGGSGPRRRNAAISSRPSMSGIRRR